MDSGDRFSELYQAHFGAVLRYAMRRTDRETARDVAAETFLIAWRRLGAVPADPGRARPWLYGVARRVLANAERSRHRAQRVTARLGEQQQEPVPDTAGAVVERIRLAYALAGLPAGDREALRLIGWEELDLAGAAVVMGCSRSAMAVRIYRARRRLERALRAAEDAAADEERNPAPRQVAPVRVISQETR